MPIQLPTNFTSKSIFKRYENIDTQRTWVRMLTVAKHRKWLKWPSTGKWIHKLQHIYTMDYHIRIRNQTTDNIHGWISITLSCTKWTRNKRYVLYGTIYIKFKILKKSMVIGIRIVGGNEWKEAWGNVPGMMEMLTWEVVTWVHIYVKSH